MRLFHGSNMRVERIDLSRSKRFKDFGQAFYLSDDEEQDYHHEYDIVYGPIINDTIGFRCEGWSPFCFGTDVSAEEKADAFVFFVEVLEPSVENVEILVLRILRTRLRSRDWPNEYKLHIRHSTVRWSAWVRINLLHGL